MSDTPVAANRAHSLLTTLLNYAISQGWRFDKENVCAGIQRYKEEERRVSLSHEKLAALFAHLNARRHRQQANALLLLLLTGARLREVLEARWNEFDLAHAFWTRPAERTKTKKTYTTPLNRQALTLLREMHAQHGKDEWLFPNREGEKAQHSLRGFWDGVCKATGIKGLRVHDLRHLYASALISHGVPLAAIAPLLGHANSTMTQRYAHLSDQALRAAAEVADTALPALTPPSD
jgi:integrase